MANVNKLKVSGTTHRLYDRRLSDGTSKKTSSTTGGLAGDIYVYKNAETTTTSGDWTYFTEPNGFTVCYKVLTGTVDPSATWSVIEVVDNFIKTSNTYPITFKSNPMVHCFINSPYAWLYSYAGSAFTTTHTAAFGFATLGVNGAGWGSRSYRIEIVVMGEKA